MLSIRGEYHFAPGHNRSTLFSKVTESVNLPARYVTVADYSVPMDDLFSYSYQIVWIGGIQPYRADAYNTEAELHHEETERARHSRPLRQFPVHSYLFLF